MINNRFILEFLQSGTIFSLGKDRLLLGWGKRTWTSSPKDSKTPWFYFPDFFLKNNNAWFQQEFFAEITTHEFLEILPTLSAVSNYKWNNTHQKHFANAFIELQQKFLEGSLKKAVPYVMETSIAKMDEPQLVISLKELIHHLHTNPLHIYGFWDSNEGILGATPELFFHYSSNEKILKTVACAGTCSLSENPEHLLIDPKQREEHQLVIDGIKKSLDPFGLVNTGKIHVVRLPKLAHLVTPIELNLHRSFDFSAIVQSLHPTPALGAFPKNTGTAWLQSYGIGMPRGRYGAPAGYIYKDQACCYVAIRNVQWDSKGSSIGAGCGVVAESKLEDEWREIELKLHSIKTLLGLR